MSDLALPPGSSTGNLKPSRSVSTTFSFAPVVLPGAALPPLAGCSQGASYQAKTYIPESRDLDPSGGPSKWDSVARPALDKGKQRFDKVEGIRSLDSDLWTSKHRPQKMADLVGNGGQVCY